MDADMVAMFPNGIRALMIDDDTKFLKSATTLLSVLNFDVVRCGSVAHALKSLTGGILIGFDVILVHAANVAACGFDFRAIVETDLLIPVIYFLEEDYEATGDEADELLRTLQAAGSYTIKKPLDIEEVRTRLWMVIAFRKCDLQTKASMGGAAGGEGVGGDNEDRVHFKVVTKGRGRKRKGASSRNHPGRSSTGTTVATRGHRAAKGKEKENVGSQQQPAQQNDGRAKKAQKNGGGEAYNLPHQPNTTMTNGQQQQHVQHHPKPSDDLFMQSFLRMLAVPPNNPKFFMGAAEPSSAAVPFGNNINTIGGAPAAPRARPLYSASAAPPTLPLVAHQQQHPSAHNSVIFGNIAPSSAAAPTMAVAATTAYDQGISNKQQQQEEDEVHPLLMFGPFPYQGPTPLPPVVQQDIRRTEAVAYGNDVSLPFLQAPNLGAERDGAKELAGTLGMDIMYSSMAPPMANVLDLLFSDDFNDVGSSVVASGDVDQVPGMASSLDEITTLAGGAFGSSNAEPLMASQGQGTGAAAMEGDDNAAGHKEAMIPSDQYEDDDNTSFPLDALLGDLHGPMFELDDDDDLDAMQVGGSTGGGAAAADDASGTSLIVVEEGGGENGLANLAGIDIPHDVWHLNDLPSPQSKNKNDVRK